MEFSTGPITEASCSNEFGMMNAASILIRKNFKPSQKKAADGTILAPTKEPLSLRQIAKFVIPVSSGAKFQPHDEQLKSQLSIISKVTPTLNPEHSMYNAAFTSEQLSITALMLLCKKVCVHQDAEVRLMLVRTVDNKSGKDVVRTKLVVLVNADNSSAMETVLSGFRPYVTATIHVISETTSTTQQFTNLFSLDPSQDYALTSSHVINEHVTVHLTQLAFMCTRYAVCSENHAPSDWETDMPELTLPLKSASAGSKKRKAATDEEESAIKKQNVSSEDDE